MPTDLPRDGFDSNSFVAAANQDKDDRFPRRLDSKQLTRVASIDSAFIENQLQHLSSSKFVPSPKVSIISHFAS